MESELHRPSFGIRANNTFTIMVGVSIAAHVALLAALIFGSLPGPRRINENRAIQTKLVKLGQNKPDLLPRMETPPPPPAAAPAVVSPTPVPSVAPPKPAKDEKKSSFEDSLKRIEQMEHKEDFKGKGDPKGSKHGTVSDFTKQMIGLQWVEDVRQRIHPNLNIPSVIPDAERSGLKVTVTLYVASNGKVLKKNVQSGSGNELFDKAVMRAIEQSSPLPAPPAELRDQVQSDGVDIEFLGRH